MEQPSSNPVAFASGPAVSQDSKNLAMLTWIGTLCLGFIPSLIVYLVKTDDDYVRGQAREALNWCITCGIVTVVSFVLMLLLVGFVLLWALGVCHLVFCILGVIATSSGKPFQVPLAIRLLK